jgi:hypothetical protein
MFALKLKIPTKFKKECGSKTAGAEGISRYSLRREHNVFQTNLQVIHVFPIYLTRANPTHRVHA